MSHILRAVQLHPTLLWSTQLLLEHWDASHIHGTSQQFPLGKSILCALAAVTCSVISSLPTFQHRIPPDRDGNLLQELLLRLLVPSTDRLSALGTQCSVVLPLIKLQHQFQVTSLIQNAGLQQNLAILVLEFRSSNYQRESCPSLKNRFTSCTPYWTISSTHPCWCWQHKQGLHLPREQENMKENI